MSENLRLKAAAAMTGVGLAFLGGCAVDTYPDEPSLERCFDTPQPVRDLEQSIPKLPEEPKKPKRRDGESRAEFQLRNDSYYDALVAWSNEAAEIQKVRSKLYDPENVKVPVRDGYTEGRSFPIEENVAAATKAIVEITTDDWKGTGFVIDHDGEQYVVTAAHVMSTAKLDQLTFTTHSGKKHQPIGGCYLYENHEGKFMKVADGDSLSEGKIGDIDLAIFTLDEEITDKPLKLASKMPKPGARLDFVNYQGAYGPDDSEYSGDIYSMSADFTGILTPMSADSRTFDVITGAIALGEDMTVGDFEGYHFVGGGSGGPVLNERGEVLGETYSGTKDDIYLSKWELKHLYDIEFPGAIFGSKTGFEPTTATAVPFSIIKQALESPELD